MKRSNYNEFRSAPTIEDYLTTLACVAILALGIYIAATL
jgi:hypothetical protein